MEYRDRRLSRWGLAVSLIAFANGSIEVSFTPHIPWLAERLHIGPGALGTALAGLPVGLLIGSLLGGLLCRMAGSRAIVVLGGLAFFGSLPFTVLAPSWSGLALTLFLAGLANGLLDAAWVLQSNAYANARGGGQRHLATSAMFSLGSVVAVLVALAALSLGLSPVAHLCGVAAVTVVIALLVLRRLPGAPERDPVRVQDETGAVRVDPRTSTFAMLCLAAFLAFFPLGAAYSWSTPHLTVLGAQQGLIVGGLLAYTVCEGVGRLIAYWISKTRLSPVAIVAVGGVLALGGGLMVVLSQSVLVVVAGWGLVALGISPAGPIWQAAGNNSAKVGNRAIRVAVLTAAGYVGSMVGLPVIGWAAQATSLRVALGLVPLAAVLMLLFARAARAARPVTNA